jgi:TatD DNase family protein
LRTLASQLRADRVILETDAPYLAPHPHRGQRNKCLHSLIAEAPALAEGAPVRAVAGGRPQLSTLFLAG